MKDYDVPGWGALPSEYFALEVLKNGVLVDTIPLEGKDHFIVGRQPDVCHIALEHPSISRMHAVLQFRNDGILMIFDMTSAHGTFVNKKELPKGVYHRLNVGDFVKFGASTRSYIVCGPESQRPEEYDSENTRLVRKKITEQSVKLLEKQKEVEDNGIDWGFREDAQEEDDDLLEEENLPDYVKNDPNYERKYGDKFSTSIKDSEVSEKDQQLLEKLRKKERKIQNMQQEIARIYMKETSQENGLTTGQIAAIERNDKRIEVLKEQVEALEKTLKEKNEQRESSKSNVSKQQEIKEKQRKSKEKEIDDLDDDRFDTTQATLDANTNWRLKKKQNQSLGNKNTLSSLLSSTTPSFSSSKQKSQTKDDAVSYEQMIEEKDIKQQRLNHLLTEIQRHESIIQQTNVMKEGESNPEKNSLEEIDELDKYLLESQREESITRKEESLREAQSIMASILQLEKYIQVAAPALPTLSTKGTHQDHPVSTLPPSVIKQDIEQKIEKPQPNEIELLLPPVAVETVAIPQKKNSSTAKRSRAVLAVSNAHIQWENEVPKLDTHKEISEESQLPPKKMKPQDVPQTVFSGNDLEGGDRIWVPPKNQTGDGKTALNAKYGY